MVLSESRCVANPPLYKDPSHKPIIDLLCVHRVNWLEPYAIREWVDMTSRYVGPFRLPLPLPAVYSGPTRSMHIVDNIDI